jgi:hypothetical protein
VYVLFCVKGQKYAQQQQASNSLVGSEKANDKGAPLG